MTFLNPLVLFGLIAAVIPLVIHLFNFRRPRKIDFSSLVFLKELQQTTMQRVRIKQWLLLLMRTAAIACLVLAFARPTLEGSIAGVLAGEAESAVVIVIDNSMSMTARDQDGILMEQAIGLAEEIVELMRPGDQLSVVRTAGATAASSPTWFKTRTAARDAVSSVEASFGRAELAGPIEIARDLLHESTFVNREIFVISDFQASTLGEVVAELRQPRLPVRLIRLGGSASVSNASLESVAVVSQIIEQNQPVRLRAVISSAEAGQALSNLASVFLDDERVAQASVQSEPDAPTAVDFAVTPRESGWLRGEVRIEDDDFPVDNSRFFTLYVPDERRVLLVKGPAFRSDYLELVLSSRLASGRTRFDVSTISSRQLSSATLTEFDVVVIAGVANFSSGEVASLAGYAKEGGGMLLFPPATTDLGNFGEFLNAIAGGSIRGVVGTGSGEAVAEVGFVDLDHPLFEGVFDVSEGPGEVQVERTEVFRYADYAAAHSAEQTLMRLSSGSSFLQEMRPGRGRALFMTTLPDPAWSTLPVRGLFVPLLFRSLHYLSSGDAVTGGEVILGQSSDVRISAVASGAPASVRSRDVEFVPVQRSAFGGTLVTLGPDLASPGVADILIDDVVVRRVAVNADAREFDLRLLDSDAAASALGGSEAGVEVLRPGAGGRALAEEVQTLRTGVELWNVFLALALAFLLAEMLVARHWNPEAASG